MQGSLTNLLGREWFRLIKPDWREVHSVGSDAIEGLKSKYSQVFEPDLGELKDVFIRLLIRLPRTLSNSSCRRTSRLEFSVLEPASSRSWAASLVPVLKKDGTVRVCANFKLTANSAVKLDSYSCHVLRIFLRSFQEGMSSAR